MSLNISDAAAQRIKQLTLLKTSTLSNRLLKLSEEVGELSRAVLNHTEAPGCTYRSASKANIVEETVDVLMVAMSILHELDNVSQVELDSTFNSKLDKWEDVLIGDEDKTKTVTYPHELHLTVRLTATQTKDDFVSVCREVGCKPVLIELQRNGTCVGEDVMTSDTVVSTTTSAFQTLEDQVAHFQHHGFEVIRTKIETVPWHPMVPVTSGEHEGYFETHIPVLMSDTIKPSKDELLDMCTKHDAHLSRNKFKQIDEDSYTIMCTLRSYVDVAHSFQHKVAAFTNDLLAIGCTIPKRTNVEYVLHDSNMHHDDAWIKK